MRTILVGGARDGEVADVHDFRESSAPEGYEPMDTYGAVLDEPFHREASDALPARHSPQTKCRLEVCFARGMPEDERDARLSLALARALGLLFRGPFDRSDPFWRGREPGVFGEVKIP